MPSDETRLGSQMVAPNFSVRTWFNGSTFAYIAFAIVIFASFLALKYNFQEDEHHLCKFSTLGRYSLLQDGSYQFHIVVITDLDKKSKDPTKENQWRSFMKSGILVLNSDRTEVSIQWNEKKVILYSNIAASGRSMELSDLVVYDGNLLSIDDRTGLLYRIENNTAYPWVFISDGCGISTTGFKGEWMTVKGDDLWVGGLGKEWTTFDGEYINSNPMWVKRITSDGSIEHISWDDKYKKLRAAVGIHWPGYLIHESVQWSDIYGMWFFLPRRASKMKYNDVEDEERGTDYLLTATEDFSHVTHRHIGNLTLTRGFSGFQFVPCTADDIIIAVKSEEKEGLPWASYVTVFNHKTSQILLEETLIDNLKYEGIAFV